MNPLEKLGLKCPVDEINSICDAITLFRFLKLDYPDHMVNNAKILLKQRKEWEMMLEALIGSCLKGLEIEELLSKIRGNDPEFIDGVNQDKRILAIESALNMKWSDSVEKLKE